MFGHASLFTMIIRIEENGAGARDFRTRRETKAWEPESNIGLDVVSPLIDGLLVSHRRKILANKQQRGCCIFSDF